MKKLFFFFFTLISGYSFAQQSIISIDLKNMPSATVLDSYKLPLLFVDEKLLVTIASEPILDKLRNRSIIFSVISEINAPDNYYLISDFQEKNRMPAEGLGEVIFESKNFLIAKELQKNIGYFFQNGFSVSPINNIKAVYKSASERIQMFYPMQNTSLIDEIIDDINPDTVKYFIQSLQDFGTRYLYADNREEVAEWIKNEFERFGFTDVKLDSFYFNGTWQMNVVATLPGTANPEKVIVVGGHHDSITYLSPMSSAPGADDNASGTAAALEIARAFKLNGFQPEATIKFVTFAAEEAGLHGAFHFAESAFLNGMVIKLMINHDMISNSTDPLASSYVNVNYYSGAEEFRDLAGDCVNNYSDIRSSQGGLNSGGSDSYAFWQYGFPAVYFDENHFSPYYHSDDDVIGHCNMEYCAEIIKSSAALAITVSETPQKVVNLHYKDCGNGNSIQLVWVSNEENDLDKYIVRYGTAANSMNNVVQIKENYLRIEGLSADVQYYFSVTAVDNDGNESVPQMITAVSHVFPIAPLVTAKPIWHGVKLDWSENHELDLAGYNIYRAEHGKSEMIKLNSDYILAYTFTDETCLNGIYYDYVVKAADTDLNESIDNEVVKSRCVSLDGGILIVDESADGNGDNYNPTDEQVDDFFDTVLSHYSCEKFDVEQNEGIGLADIGTYSIIVWHGNDNNDLDNLFPMQNDLREYLNYGGKFLYAGYKPSTVFDNISNSVYEMNESSFLFDYSKVGKIETKLLTYFSGAQSAAAGYPELQLDPDKVPTNNNQLRFIESIQPNSPGKTIYLYDSNYDPSTIQGSMKGMPVGVEYIGQDYSIITLSFPLYYVKSDQAESFMNFVLANKFNQTTNILDEAELVPSSMELKQNYPNPFNPTTVISFQLSLLSKVQLKIYDVLGREVATLVDEIKPAGYYDVKFDGSNLTSGVYFYRMQAGGFSDTKKLILMK
ncbi:MAG: M20/M25/M40 family metallo-hydrolase [bacterium]